MSKAAAGTVWAAEALTSSIARAAHQARLAAERARAEASLPFTGEDAARRRAYMGGVASDLETMARRLSEIHDDPRMRGWIFQDWPG